jgi:TusA-related sulfurtransferase
MGSSKRYLNVKGMTGTQSTSQVQQTLLLMAEGETLQVDVDTNEVRDAILYTARQSGWQATYTEKSDGEYLMTLSKKK